MTDPLRIRYAHPDDAAELIDLINRLALETRFLVVDTIDPVDGLDAVADHLAAAAESTLHCVLVAEVEDQLVGIGLGLSEAHVAKRGSMRVDLGLLAAFHRRGIGRQLLAGLELAARDRGCHRIDLLVMTDNIPAMRLYQSAGFEFEGRLHRHLVVDGVYVDQFLMAKMLD
jgi:ribosomal protein S18 acetylase RimI-like enzyme